MAEVFKNTEAAVYPTKQLTTTGISSDRNAAVEVWVLLALSSSKLHTYDGNIPVSGTDFSLVKANSGTVRFDWSKKA